MKYYGIERKKQQEELFNKYAHLITKLKTYIPGKKGKEWKQEYDFIFSNSNIYNNDWNNNAIPEDKYLKLNRFVTADLISREDIDLLKKGMRWLFQNQRAGDRYLLTSIDSTDVICNTIDNMDSDLLSWNSFRDCGVFDFRGMILQNTIDYFSVTIRTLNSLFFTIEFDVFLNDNIAAQLDHKINSNYVDKGKALKYLSTRENGRTITKYTISREPGFALKAREIDEFISCIQWEFYDALNKHFPFLLFKLNIKAPRIDVFLTNIDYHEDHRMFWPSLGIEEEYGQFINEKQKMFFTDNRFALDQAEDRMIYIAKEDNTNQEDNAVIDDVAFHLDCCASEYFRSMFLSVLMFDIEKSLVFYKHKLDKIKVQRKKLKSILKLRYEYEKKVENFETFFEEYDWEKSKGYVREFYEENDELLAHFNIVRIATWHDYFDIIQKETYAIRKRLIEIRSLFESKERVLHSLADYRNSQKNWLLNLFMMLIAAGTLFFVIFPEKATTISTFIRTLYKNIKTYICLFLYK